MPEWLTACQTSLSNFTAEALNPFVVVVFLGSTPLLGSCLFLLLWISFSKQRFFFFFVFFYSQFGCDIYLFASLCKTGSAKIPKLAMNSVLWSYVWLECAVISPANFVCLNETSFWIVLVSSGIWFLLWFGFFSFRKILAYLFTMSFCIWRFSLVIHAESIPAFNNHLLFHL